MRDKRFRVLILACLSFLIFGCTPKSDSASTREFSFSSGGAHHIEGYGEWIVTLDQDGNFAVKYNVSDVITDYGTFNLTPEENDSLWAQVKAANIDELKTSHRLGLPDEVQYTLSLTENGTRHEVQIWIGEVREIEALVKLVAQIGVLIEAYTGQQPVLN